MESSDRNKKSESRMDGRTRRQVQGFGICLMVSTITWLFIKLSKDYVSEIVYPVVYINMPKGKVLTNVADTTLLVSQKSNGYYTLLQRMIGPRNKLYIDLSELKLKKNGPFYEVSLPTSELEEKISSQLNKNEKLVSIAPYSLFFRFAPVRYKKVPIKLNLNLQYEKQYGLYDRIYMDTDSVTVIGAARQVGAIKEISTENQNLNGIHESFYLTMPLTRGNYENISLSKDYIHVFVPVVQYTEASIMVPVFLDKAQAKYSIRTYPEKIKITYKVAMRDYKKVDESMFKVTIPVKAALAEGSNKIKVELNRYPEFTELVRIEPEYVEYIILK